MKLIAKFALLKLIGENHMDFGDIVFSWGKDKSQRYYHLFTEKELINLCYTVDYKIDNIIMDSYNYYLVISIA
jgi:hypothetical protein